MMRNLGEREGAGAARRRPEPLDVKLPSFFRCPISLEVMRSPVSLCSGVTYDRSSIQRWLDSGHRFCPATRLPLPSNVDLVPNLTLRRLILLWSDASLSSTLNQADVDSDASLSILLPPPLPTSSSPLDILLDLRSSSFSADDRDGILPPLRGLADFFLSSAADDADKNQLAAHPDCVPALVSVIVGEGDASEAFELAVAVLAAVLVNDRIESNYKELAVSALAAEFDRSIPALLRVMKKSSGASENERRVDAARLLELILSSSSTDAEKITGILDNPDLFLEIIRMIEPAEDGGPLDFRAIEAGLRCLLAALASAERRFARTKMVRAGVVPALARVLAATEVPAAVADGALRAMEEAAGCAAGRGAICEAADECMGSVMSRILKAGREGREAAVGVLWACCVAGRDRRAREAATAVRGGGAKILVVMQGECSPATARMAGELLKIFRGSNAKSCFAGYDTKTIHIMPF